MSRVGKKAISVPSGVRVEISQGVVQITGPKGKLTTRLHPRIKAAVTEGEIRVTRPTDSRSDRALHGLMRSLIANMVEGVTAGFAKELEIVGVGYRAQVQEKTLKMQLRHSHPIVYPFPEGITIETPQPTRIIVTGIDKARVGQTAAEIRAYCKPEPYKGKGIRYVGEYIRRKAGKAVATAT